MKAVTACLALSLALFVIAASGEDIEIRPGMDVDKAAKIKSKAMTRQ